MTYRLPEYRAEEMAKLHEQMGQIATGILLRECATELRKLRALQAKYYDELVLVRIERDCLKGEDLS